MEKTFRTYRFGAARLYVIRVASGSFDVQFSLNKPEGTMNLRYMITQEERSRFMSVILEKMKRQIRYALNEGRNITQTELQL